MTTAEILARIDGWFRPYICSINPYLSSFIYSYGRKLMLAMLANDVPETRYNAPDSLNRKLWGLTFAAPLFNAAGMFKKGEAYNIAVAQGAGAWLAGTSTANPRKGNSRKFLLHPFVPYTYSYSASNWMGLPNEGHEEVARKISRLEKHPKCPVGASISPDTGLSSEEILSGVLDGFNLYDRAGADFIELNESCPNVDHDHNCKNALDANLIDRLEFISKYYLKKRQRNLPVIIKLSNDTDMTLIPAMIDILDELGFDGINLGNTSTDYIAAESFLSPKDIKNFEYFRANFGGGLSGRLLKERSLKLSAVAAEHIAKSNLHREFHVIRTGGVETIEDIRESEKAGITLNQWFTGYFELFSKYGHQLYSRFFAEPK